MSMTIRKPALKVLLLDQQREIQGELRSRIRDGRGDRWAQGGDEQERADADNQDDVDFSVLQMKADTLSRINEALARLERGQSGLCQVCWRPISAQRLLALPFAVRCRDCESRREQDARRAQAAGADHSGVAAFPSPGKR